MRYLTFELSGKLLGAQISCRSGCNCKANLLFPDCQKLELNTFSNGRAPTESTPQAEEKV